MGIEKVYEAAFFLQVFAYHGVSSHKLTFQSRYSQQRNSEIASSKWRLRCKNGHTYLFEDKTCVVIVKLREVFVVIICRRWLCTRKEAAQHFDFLGLAFSFRLTCFAYQHPCHGKSRNYTRNSHEIGRNDDVTSKKFPKNCMRARTNRRRNFDNAQVNNSTNVK